MLRSEDLNWLAVAWKYLGGVPDHYVVIDTETSGLNRDLDLILELGWVELCGGQEADAGNMLLRWSPAQLYKFGIDLSSKLEHVRYAMSQRGDTYHLTPELLSKEGVDATQALDAFRDSLRTIFAGQVPLAGHNVFGFDLPIIRSNLYRVLGFDLQLQTQLLDTALLEKARLAGITPQAGVEIREWYDRIDRTRSREKFNLRLTAERYGVPFDRSQAHGALYDSRTVARVIEQTRTMLRAA